MRGVQFKIGSRRIRSAVVGVCATNGGLLQVMIIRRAKMEIPVYWKEVHAEAWRRIRETGFLEWKRLSTSVVVPIVSGAIQWFAGVAAAVNLARSISAGLVLLCHSL
jgi:hypothetical protein